MVLGIGESLSYRVRLFDNDNFIRSYSVPDKGQKKFTLTVHKDLYGFGEATKLDFMLNPKIKPKQFGKVFEVDYDIRDAVQLGDLLDVDPDFVYSVNKNYKEKKDLRDRMRDTAQVQDAEYNIKDDPLMEDLKQPATAKNVDPITDEEDDSTYAETVVKGVKDLVDTAATVYPFMKIPGKQELSDKQKEELIPKCLLLCQKHPKLLYWLPDRLNIGPEVHAIVSQTMIYSVGVDPIYYNKQSGAQIAEKLLVKPAEKKDWQDVVIMAIVVIGILGTIGLIVWLLRG
jgi:nitrate reductase NapE component